jgi:ubiquinone/menaquinone biosynthesis C-methylase UbiE
MFSWALAFLGFMRSMAIGDAAESSPISGYDRIAQDYDKGRPDYPQAIVPILTNALHLQPGNMVLDLAAGTGKLTKALKNTGVCLYAVEPVAEMRAVFSKQFPEIPIMEGQAEAIALPPGTVDTVVVGTAFHWFEGEKALNEIARVLKPGGSLGLVWNVFDIEVEWVKQIGLVLQKYEKNTIPTKHKWEEAFQKNASFSALKHLRYTYSYQGNAQDVIARLCSAKVMGILSQEKREQLVNEVLAVLQTHPDTQGKESFDIPYRVEIYWCHKTHSAPNSGSVLR